MHKLKLTLPDLSPTNLLIQSSAPGTQSNAENDQKQCGRQYKKIEFINYV